MTYGEVVLGLVQMKMVSEPQTNLEKAVTMIGEAADRGAQIVCLPELFTTPYFPQYDVSTERNREDAFHDTIPGDIDRTLSSAARKNGIILVGGSIYERAGDHFFNTAPVYDREGKRLGKYRKIHIPYDENFYEQSYFEPGDIGFQTMPTDRGCVAPLICYDQWFPEAARACALKGAEILLYPTAIGTVDIITMGRRLATGLENVMRGHAIATSVVVAAGTEWVERIGWNSGRQFVIDAF